MLWAKSIKQFGNFGHHFSHSTSAKTLAGSSQHVRACAAQDGAICSKNWKVVPYHRANPNTRNGACLRSPSPIMAPGLRAYLTKGSQWGHAHKTLWKLKRFWCVFHYDFQLINLMYWLDLNDNAYFAINVKLKQPILNASVNTSMIVINYNVWPTFILALCPQSPFIHVSCKITPIFRGFQNTACEC